MLLMTAFFYAVVRVSGRVLSNLSFLAPAVVFPAIFSAERGRVGGLIQSIWVPLGFRLSSVGHPIFESSVYLCMLIVPVPHPASQCTLVFLCHAL
ncbi:hypothetical protein PLICRDRAFT_227094 [Plicaturopsis crispa FD-325 SS-3]|nr:hypothetical protein PLICRDRAFT_227094 [Plicaturopsis crispa FD-325 SS-3]